METYIASHKVNSNYLIFMFITYLMCTRVIQEVLQMPL